MTKEQNSKESNDIFSEIDKIEDLCASTFVEFQVLMRVLIKRGLITEKEYLEEFQAVKNERQKDAGK